MAGAIALALAVSGWTAVVDDFEQLILTRVRPAPDTALPIIIATGRGPGAIDASIRSLQNLTIMTKPYDFEDLRVAIELFAGNAA